MLQELFARGILFLGAHNISAAHSASNIENALTVYREVLPWIHEHAVAGTIRDYLQTDPLVPLFSVR